MAIALFLKVAGAQGESKNAAYADTTELEWFEWGTEQPTTIESGGGGGAGKVDFHNLTCRATVDKVYPSLLIYCAKGEHISKVEIIGAKMGGEQIEYFKITMEKVLCTKVDVSGSKGAEVVALYSFQGATVKSEYSVQTDTGTKGATSEFGWNIKENKKM
jgi:type VI secretion system secreted protein Hcp